MPDEPIPPTALTAPLPVLVLTGPPGVGKSSLAEEIWDQLAARGVPDAFVDLDALRMSYPFPEGDAFNERIALSNLRDVWRNYARGGAQRLVPAQVLETREYLDRLAGVLPESRFAVCRLTDRPETVRERLGRREVGSSLEKLIGRAEYLDAWYRRNEVADLVLPTDGVPLPELAATVLARVGWL
jgi:GTPase SAR1 family protein